ncbi:MAG: peptidoglycan D,D-transpeptidase FtsI family protein [Verrucomicrobiales bacterium]
MPASSTTSSSEDRPTPPLGRRVISLSVLLVTLFSLLTWRLVNLHLFQGDRLKLAAEAERLRKVEVPSQRGAILDRRGEVLALDRRVFAVVVDRNRLRDMNLAMRTLAAEQGLRPMDIPRLFSEEEMRRVGLERAVQVVAPHLGLSPAHVREAIGDQPRGEVVLARDLSDEQAHPLKSAIENARIPGVFLRENMKRLYPSPERAVHVIGFVNNEHEGVDGVEKALNRQLRGEEGWRWLERDSRGGETRSKSRASRPVRHGNCIRLTLDLGIQNIVEQALDETGSDPLEVYVPQIHPERVTVVLMDPNTGGILAMASRPHHSLATRENLTSNAAVAETYEPGSTFKISAYTGAFDSRLVSLTTPLNLHGGRYDKGDVHIRDDEPKDSLPVLAAFAHSSNIAAFKIAQQLGAPRFFQYMKNFGFGERTGIELPREASGRLRPWADWEVTSLPHLAYGYEISVSPLQLLNAYAAVLNDGMLRRPRLVEAIVAPDGTLVEERSPQDLRRVCSQQAARNIRRLLCEVVKSGTGKLAAIPGYEVAGKTGTAQKWNGTCYPKDTYIVSFVGFAPAEKPALIGIVVVDDPKVDAKKEYGGTIAAPLFRRIVGRALDHLGISPSPSLLAKSAPSVIPVGTRRER